MINQQVICLSCN